MKKGLYLSTIVNYNNYINSQEYEQRDIFQPH